MLVSTKNCPTCGHEMIRIGQLADGGGTVKWCEKCGTMVRRCNQGGGIYIPWTISRRQDVKPTRGTLEPD